MSTKATNHLYNTLRVHREFAYVKKDPYNHKVSFRWRGAKGGFTVLFTTKMGFPWYEISHNGNPLTGNSLYDANDVLGADTLLSDLRYLSRIPNFITLK